MKLLQFGVIFSCYSKRNNFLEVSGRVYGRFALKQLAERYGENKKGILFEFMVFNREGDKVSMEELWFFL